MLSMITNLPSPDTIHFMRWNRTRPNNNAKVGHMGYEFQMRNYSDELDIPISIIILILTIF